MTKMYTVNFVVIGEMVEKLSEKFKREHNNIEWIKIKGFRNIVAHDYFGIDAEEVWQIIKNKIPSLKIELEKLPLYLTSPIAFGLRLCY